MLKLFDMKLLNLFELILLVQVSFVCSKWLPSTKLTGNSLEKKVPFEKCYSICTEYFNCFGVSYKNNICYLFDYDFIVETEEGWQSKTKRDLVFQKPFINKNLKLYNDLNWNTYKSFIALESSCWRACKMDSLCISITHNQIDNRCNLFFANFPYGFERTQGWNSYTIRALNFSNTIENRNIKLSNHYKKKNILLKEKCWAACLGELKSCVAVSFKQEICYFYGWGYEVTKEDASITITTRAIKLNILQYNKTFLGFGFKTIMINNFRYDECYITCLNTSLCIGISYNASACYLNDNSYAYERLNNFSTSLFNQLDKSIRFIYDDIKIKTSILPNMIKDIDIDGCWSRCLDDHDKQLHDCKAISYSNKTCYLFYEFSMSYSDTIATGSRFISIKRINEIMELDPAFKYQNTRLSNPIEIALSGSVNDCWKKCGKSSKRCAAISFKPLSSHCSLFDSNFKFEKESGWISWTTFKFDFMNYFVSKNIRLIGPNNELKAKSEKECWNYCMNQIETICQSTSFFNQRCLLFPSRVLYEKAIGWSTLTSNQIDFRQHFTYKDIALKTSQYSIYNSSSIEECWTKCLDEPLCNGITYWKTVCFLFQSGFESETKMGAVSFTTTKIKYPSPIILNNVRYYFHFDEKSFPIENMNEESLITKCWLYCEESKICASITMRVYDVTMVCNLYDTNSYFRSDSSWISLTSSDLDF